MNEAYPTWLNLLSEQESLLNELEADLDAERKALLANEIVSLKESSLRKDRTLSRVQDFQKKFLAFRQQVCRAAGIKSSTLNALFNRYEGEERRTLQKKRQELARRSNAIHRINQFNEDCLKSHLDHLRVFSTIFGMAAGGSPTYTAAGAAPAAQKSGRLLSCNL